MKKHLIYSHVSSPDGCRVRVDDKGTDPAPDPNPDPVPLREYYAGGKLGTAFNTTSVAYEQPTPVVDDDAAMTQRFLNGEALFEKPSRPTRRGVRYGPGRSISAPRACTATGLRPRQAYRRRVQHQPDRQRLLLVITDEDDNYYLTSSPVCRKRGPWRRSKAPIDESKIMIGWQEYTDECNKFPDGESLQPDLSRK